MSEQSEQTPAQLREFAERQKERADAAEAALAQAQTAQRENAFLRAGVDLDSPLGAMFAKGYDGDATPEAVKEAWATIAPAAEPPAPSDGPTPAELAHAQASAAVSTGALPPGEEPSEDPWTAAMATYNGSRAKGQTVERAQAAGLQHVFNAAVDGDTRVIYDRDRWKAQFEQ